MHPASGSCCSSGGGERGRWKEIHSSLRRMRGAVKEARADEGLLPAVCFSREGDVLSEQAMAQHSEYPLWPSVSSSG